MARLLGPTPQTEKNRFQELERNRKTYYLQNIIDMKIYTCV